MTSSASALIRSCVLLCTLAGLSGRLVAAATAPAAPTDAPLVAAVIALSAKPEALSVGRSGPFNRQAFDVVNFRPEDPGTRLVCIYPGDFAYRCDVELAPDAADGPRTRLVVTIPDLGRGNRVIVRLTNGRSSRDVPVEIANGPQTVHEIEAVLLPEGGRVGTDSRGISVPLSQLATRRATTTPAMATTSQADARTCGRAVPHWVGVSATDPVFTSAFGALNGSVLLARPAPAGSPVRTDNLPEWLITYPLSATRVQFIAHYEVIYRVLACADRIERD